MKKFAIVLSGCGVQDGAEIQESVLLMLAVSRRGHDYRIFAPDIPQRSVINHLTGRRTSEQRNVWVESARIARGDAKDLAAFSARDYDALVFAGGFGAASNLCDFVDKGDGYSVIPEVARAIREMRDANKPVGATCVAPVLLAPLIKGVELTLGNECDASRAAVAHGAVHRITTHGEVTVDVKNKVATTPCYMLDATIAQIADGAEHLIDELLQLM
ncbi:MAG: isoprenoid biosynthesis glyoxalase ElbB [Bacteroidales bacterium]|jgi:enhancing lycopene biosynthesis protein 2|nr:isoprenoid biosynthesis glyoxalase ElbB [Bacteroidales bacterium]